MRPTIIPVNHSFLHHKKHFLRHSNIVRRIAGHGHHIGNLARLERPQPVGDTEQFSIIDPTHESWANYFDETYLASFQGAAYYTLALTGRDPRAADRAVPLIRQAGEGFGPDYARSRALRLPDLAGAHAIAGDTDTAVTLGHHAIDAVTAVSSPRAHDQLRVLDTVLEPLHTGTGVAELRDRLTTTTA